MAHLLPRLIGLRLLLILWTAGAVFGQFSHRRHLELKLQCATCHPTQQLPKAEVCAGCHTDSKPIKEHTPRRVDKFGHARHAKFGNIAPILRAAVIGKTYLSEPPPQALDTKNACAGCHHGIEQSENVSAASVFPHMADCLVCHSQIDPPFSCEKCHNNPQALKPASHTPNWLDAHNRKGAIQDKQSCAVCHGRQFTCLGCH